MKLLRTPGRSGRIVASAITLRDIWLKRESGIWLLKRIPHEARSTRIHACRRRIVDGDQVAVGVPPVREVAVISPRSEWSSPRARGALVAVLVGTEEERLVPAVMQQESDRAAEHAAEIMLLEGGFERPAALLK